MFVNNIGSPSIIFGKEDDDNAVVNITAPSKIAINSVLKNLTKLFTYENEKKKYTWEFDKGLIHDANDYAFDKKTQTLQIGLVPRAARYITEHMGNYKVGVSDEIREIYTNPDGDITDEEIIKYGKSLNIRNRETKEVIEPYEHQINIFREAINGRRISILACTSAGKSLSIYMMCRYLTELKNKRILVITPSKALVKQLYNNFVDDYDWEDAEEHCTLIYGESKDKETRRPITVSTWQSLQRKLPEYCDSCKAIKKASNRPKECPSCDEILSESEEFFNSFDGVIVDEAHSTRGEVLRDILSMCKNATNFKVGLSGTLPDNGLDAAWIEGSLGRKVVVIKLWQLIEAGILPPMKILGIKIPYEQKVRSYVCGQKYQDEYFLLTNNGSRKRVLDLLIDNQITTNENTLILYKNKTNLEDMRKYMEEKFPNYKYRVIKGEISVAERDKIAEELDKDTGHIIIATYGTMKQGVNIPLLHNLIFAEFSKSMYEIVQAIGRIARRHRLKKLSRVFDIYDDCSYMTRPRRGNMPTMRENYSVKHYHERLGHYKEEKLPVTEYSLEGIMEATINADSLKEKKEAAKKKAASKKTTKKSTSRKKLGSKSQFI